MIVPHLEPPFYAALLSRITKDNLKGYQDAMQRIKALAKLQKGYL